jgi:uncharacterized protein YnzC (UPF0291/DUF896 family)
MGIYYFPSIGMTSLTIIRAVSGYGKRESETVTSSEHEKVEQQQLKQQHLEWRRSRVL